MKIFKNEINQQIQIGWLNQLTLYFAQINTLFLCHNIGGPFERINNSMYIGLKKGILKNKINQQIKIGWLNKLSLYFEQINTLFLCHDIRGPFERINNNMYIALIKKRNFPHISGNLGGIGCKVI